MRVSKNARFTSLVALVGFIAMVVVNFLANALPLNNVTTGAVSDSYGNLFAPTGLTFAIWGVIYLLLGGYTLYQLKASQDYDLSDKVTKINKYYIVSSIANTLWIFAWHYRIIFATLILMAVILVSLIRIALILKDERFDARDNILVRIPFFVYFGWITVATIANVTVFLVSLGYQGYPLSQELMTAIILVVGAAIGLGATVKYRSFFYNAVLVWAYIGIGIKHLASSGFDGQYPIVLGSLVLSFVIILGGAVLLARDMSNRKNPWYS